MASNQSVGRAGEDAAALWYEQHGYNVVERNWRIREGEIDLICRRGGLIVFCEVKTRTSSRFGRGVEAVDHRKRQRLRRLAVRWLQASGRGCDDFRFDIADVDRLGSVEVYEGCF